MIHWYYHLGMDPLLIKLTSNSPFFGVFWLESLQGPIKSKEQAW
jgi:hypothetical protein